MFNSLKQNYNTNITYETAAEAYNNYVIAKRYIRHNQAVKGRLHVQRLTGLLFILMALLAPLLLGDFTISIILILFGLLMVLSKKTLIHI